MARLREIDSQPPHGQTILHAFLTTHPGPSWPTLYLDLTYPTPLLNSQNDLVVPAYPIPGLAYPRLLESNSKRRDSFRRDLPAPRLPYTSALSSLEASPPTLHRLSSHLLTRPSPVGLPYTPPLKATSTFRPALCHFPTLKTTKPSRPTLYLLSALKPTKSDRPTPYHFSHSQTTNTFRPTLHRSSFTPTQPRLAEHTLGKSRRRTA